MDTPNPKYMDERNRVLVGNLPEDFLRFNEGNQSSLPNGLLPPSQTTTVTVSPQEHHQPQQDVQHQPQQDVQHQPQQEVQHQPQQQVQYQPQQQVLHQPQQLASAQPTVNQITLTIIQAQLTKSYSLTKMDPYVKVRVGHTVFETHTSIKGGKFPHWNKLIVSYLPAGIKTLHFEIFDECTITSDERIAYADVVIPDEVFGGKMFDESIPLSGKQGIDKEGFLNITMNIRSVPYWSSGMGGSQVMALPRQFVCNPYYMPSITPQMGTIHSGYNRNYVHPSVRPQRYRLEEEDVKQIQEMFPAFDREVILGVIENCDGNKDQVITSLLSLSDK